MTTPKAQIDALLPKLTPAELQAVQINIKALLALHGAAPVSPAKLDDWLLAGIMDYLRSRHLWGGVELRPDRLAGYRKARQALEPWLAKLEAQLPTHTRHRPLLGWLCAKALGEMLEREGRLYASTMLAQTARLPDALEAAFPGYLSSGLFGYVLQARQEG